MDIISTPKQENVKNVNIPVVTVVVYKIVQHANKKNLILKVTVLNVWKILQLHKMDKSVILLFVELSLINFVKPVMKVVVLLVMEKIFYFLTVKINVVVMNFKMDYFAIIVMLTVKLVKINRIIAHPVIKNLY